MTCVALHTPFQERNEGDLMRMEQGVGHIHAGPAIHRQVHGLYIKGK